MREHEDRVRGLGARFLYEGVVPHGEGTDSGGVFFEDPDGIRLKVYSTTGAGDEQAPVSDAPSCGFFYAHLGVASSRNLRICQGSARCRRNGRIGGSIMARLPVSSLGEEA